MVRAFFGHTGSAARGERGGPKENDAHRICGKQIVIGEALPHRVREKVSSAAEKHFTRDAETRRLKNHHDRGGQRSLSGPA
jgi:hypothetical protein